MDRNTNAQTRNTDQDNPSSSVRPLSIELPKTLDNANQIEIVPNQPRQPTNLQGLLRFAMEATKAEDAPNEPTLYPIDAERKQFLEEALSSMSVNVTKELQKDVEILRNASNVREEDDPSEFEAALDRIADRVDSMDVANDFCKLGGFSIFEACLKSPHKGIRWRVANLIAELTQNNPFCQEKVLEQGYLPLLLNMVESDTFELSRIKALAAVSCIVRECALGLKHMKINDGFSVLMKTIQSPTQKLQIKTAFLLSSLCTMNKDNDLKLTLIKMGLIEQTCGLLAMGSLLRETKEQLLGLLNALVSDNYYPAMKECRRPELCLKQTLERHLKESKADDDIDTEYICKELMDIIFADLKTELKR